MELAGAHKTVAEQPTEAEMRQQFDRILSSSEFRSPQRGRAFFQYIVDETLAGRREFLKAFTIANVVFGRDASFDAQNDPVVRVEAGRIRTALERYYLLAGQDDLVIVTIPKGGYVPSFRYSETSRRPGPQPVETDEPLQTAPTPEPGKTVVFPSRSRVGYALMGGAVSLALCALLLILLKPLFMPLGFGSSQATATASRQPRILVAPFKNISSGEAPPMADALRDEVIGQLARVKDIVVVANQVAAENQAPSEEPTYMLQGIVFLEQNRFRTLLRLVRSADDVVVWANDYNGDVRTQSMFQIKQDVAEHVANTVTQRYGAVFLADAVALTNAPNSHRLDDLLHAPSR